MKMFVRNKQAIFFTLFTPLIIMGIFGLIGFDRIPKTRIGLALDAPPTSGTSQFVEEIKKISVFEVSVNAEWQERKALENDERSVVFIIPHDLLPQAGILPQAKTVKALLNTGEQQQAQTAVSVINQVLNQTMLRLTGTPQLLNLQVEELNVRNLKYIDFLVPGIVALAVMQMSVFSVGFIFTDYKEKGILKRLLATPMEPIHFVTANVITRLLVSVVQTAFLIAVGVLIFKAHVIGSYWLLLLITIIGAVMFLGLGFTISGIASTVESVPAIANLIVFPMLFLGGTFFPLETMPNWLQTFARYLPLTYFSESLRMVMTKGAEIGDIRTNLIWMIGWAVALVFLANLTFSFEGKRQG